MNRINRPWGPESQINTRLVSVALHFSNGNSHSLYLNEWDWLDQCARYQVLKFDRGELERIVVSIGVVGPFWTWRSPVKRTRPDPIAELAGHMADFGFA